MANLHRPLQLDDYLIDACKVKHFDVLNDMLTVDEEHKLDVRFLEKSELQIFQMFSMSLAEALNAPVKATKEVLEGLQKDAEIIVENGSSLTKACFNTRYRCWGFLGNWLDDYARRNEPRQIKAGDAKTLEYLLQFTTEGVKR